jgi:hypothetical protein
LLTTVDRKIGVFHGRPQSVLRSDVDADFPHDISEMPDDDGPLSIDRMVISIKLINYLEDFMLEIQLLRKRDRKELSNIIARLVEMKSELTNWWTSIPESALHVDRSLDGQAFRSCMHLRLLYCLIRMFIGRPFLFTGARFAEESPSSPPELRKTSSHLEHMHKGRENSTTSTIDGKKRPSRRIALVQTTIDAAVEALELCAALYEGTEGLARASYIEYSSCRASMLALIAFSIQEQTDQYRTIMQKGLEMSREMSAAGESARAESTLIEALERAVARLQMFGPGWQQRRESRAGLSGSNGGTDVNGHGQHLQHRQGTTYQSFRQWQQNWKQAAGSATATSSGQVEPSSGNMPPPSYQQRPPSQGSGTAVMIPEHQTINNAYSQQTQQSSPYNTSENTPAAGYVMPNATPSIASESGVSGTGVDPMNGPGGMDMFHTYNPSAAEAAFFQTLSGMPDVTPSASAVNGWLTQARPEMQVLDHFLAMPEADFDAYGYTSGYDSNVGQSTAQQGQGGQYGGEDGSSGAGAGTTSWYGLPGTTTGSGNLHGFGSW